MLDEDIDTDGDEINDHLNFAIGRSSPPPPNELKTNGISSADCSGNSGSSSGNFRNAKLEPIVAPPLRKLGGYVADEEKVKTKGKKKNKSSKKKKSDTSDVVEFVDDN